MKNLIFVLFLITTQIYGQSGDCPGLCITSNGTYSATNGSILELNTSNRGCLTAGEANSSFWFQICFSSNGIFQFYINPSGNRNDFDFAIWNTSSCPPTVPPIRCSWAAVPPGGPCPLCDYTGLGTNPITGIAASDVSEGAGGDGWLTPINVTSGQCITININNYGSGSNNFTLNLSGTTAGMTCTLLPVELLNFYGWLNQNIILQWSTSSEVNNDYFIVEKIDSTNTWITLDTVNGNGTTSQVSFYTITDYNPNFGYNYYRLKQVDYNGQSKTYTPISVYKPYINRKVKSYINTLGQEIVDLNTYSGLYLIIYEDGYIEKRIK